MKKYQKTKRLLLLVQTLVLSVLMAQAQDSLYIHSGGRIIGLYSINHIDSLNFQPGGFRCGSTITDADGNVYNTVRIGNQCWLKENLRTTKLSNGTPIYTGFNPYSPSVVWQSENEANKGIYGGFYNSQAAGLSGICPSGWHVPTDAEWTTLIDNLGGSSVAGGKLKSTSTHWQTPNVGATNSSDFSALPAGDNYSTSFYGLGAATYFFTSDIAGRVFYQLNKNTAAITRRTDFGENARISIRCLNDVKSIQSSSVTPDSLYVHSNDNTIASYAINKIDSIGFRPKTITDHSGDITPRLEFVCGTSTITDADGNVYNTVKIGNQCWLKQNLRTTIMNDESAIYKRVLNINGGGTIPGTDTTSPGDDNTGGGVVVRTGVAANGTSPRANNSRVIQQATRPEFSWYDDNENYKSTYGALYNWETARSSNICPTGWQVPTESDWNNLVGYLGGSSVAGGKLKSTSNLWTSPNQGATNSSSFTAEPAGDASARYYGLKYSTGFLAADSKGYLKLNYNTAEAAFLPLSETGDPTMSIRCIKENNDYCNTGYFTDARDGNVYKTTTIGTQTWMAENLRFLPSVMAEEVGSTTTSCYYVFDYNSCYVNQAKTETNYKTYGVLYNWPAAMAGSIGSSTNPCGVQGVCPAGWHLPSSAEWSQLSNYLGGEIVSGGRLKEVGTSHWNSPNTGTTDKFCFSALPGGMVSWDYYFNGVGARGVWWTSTPSATNESYSVEIKENSSHFDLSPGSSKGSAYSVRCIKSLESNVVIAGSISSIDCEKVTNQGTLQACANESDVYSEISYTGGNGGFHNGQIVNSTGVVGLTARLVASTFASGSGTLTYVITGKPITSGIARFAINIGGKTCELTRTVLEPKLKWFASVSEFTRVTDIYDGLTNTKALLGWSNQNFAGYGITFANNQLPDNINAQRHFGIKEPIGAVEYCMRMNYDDNGLLKEGINATNMWYLPSQGELDILKNNPEAKATLLSKKTYWTSSEINYYDSHGSYIGEEYSMVVVYKHDPLYVRCVRPDAVTVNTDNTTLIPCDLVSSGGIVTVPYRFQVLRYGVRFGITPEMTTVKETTQLQNSNFQFRSLLAPLSPFTLYYVQAYVIYRSILTGQQVTVYGDRKSFTTGSCVTVTTDKTQIFPCDSVSSGGIVTVSDGTQVLRYGVRFGTTPEMTTVKETTQLQNSNFQFRSMLTRLSPSTLYYVQAYIVCNDPLTGREVTIYGDMTSFTTGNCCRPLEFVNIPAGTFTMGSPTTEFRREPNETQHQVTLSAFRMSKYEVTNCQFAEFLNAKGIGSDGIYAAGAYPTEKLVYSSNMSLNYIGGQWVPVSGYEKHPVVDVTWYGAAEFATYVGGTLPTEAQWEYACRAGTTTPFNTGACLSNEQANYNWYGPYNTCSNTVTTSPNTALPVGSYAPNAWGLYDMHGNVWEWCADWYGNYPTTPQTNPTGPITGSLRMTRGGGWYLFTWADKCRSAFRISHYPHSYGSNMGFRVVLVP